MAGPHGPPTTRPARAPWNAYKDDDGNPAYASDLEPILLSRKPDLWVHGHVHNSNDYRIGTTRVVSNPKGMGRRDPATGCSERARTGPSTQPSSSRSETMTNQPRKILVIVHPGSCCGSADMNLGRYEARALRDQPHGNRALRQARAPGLRASGARDQERAKPRKIRRLSHEGLVSISANHYNVPDGVGPRSASAWPPWQLARTNSCVGPTCFWTPAPSHIALSALNTPVLLMTTFRRSADYCTASQTALATSL